MSVTVIELFRHLWIEACGFKLLICLPQIQVNILSLRSVGT